MTLEDIHAIYDGAYVEFQKSPVGGWSAAAAERYALRRVVEALRDEIFDARGNASYGSLAIFDLFNEILASDGVEAAGGSTREDERAGHHHSLCTPAADFCEWTTSPVALGFCSAGCQPHNAFVRPINNCHLCGKPISFKSEAAR